LAPAAGSGITYLGHPWHNEVGERNYLIQSCAVGTPRSRLDTVPRLSRLIRDRNLTVNETARIPSPGRTPRQATKEILDFLP